MNLQVSDWTVSNNINWHLYRFFLSKCSSTFHCIITVIISVSLHVIEFTKLAPVYIDPWVKSGNDVDVLIAN